MRPRGQRGQIKQHGTNWLFVYYLNSKRTHEVLGPVNVYPQRNPEHIRDIFSQKIADLLRTANAKVPNAAMRDGLLTLGQYSEQVYWKRCEDRQQ